MADEKAQDQAGEELLVKAIDKGLGARIDVRVSRFRVRDYLDIRNYYEADGGEWKPTRKGVAVPVEMYDELMSALGDAGKIIAERAANAPEAAEQPKAEG